MEEGNSSTSFPPEPHPSGFKENVLPGSERLRFFGCFVVFFFFFKQCLVDKILLALQVILPEGNLMRLDTDGEY